MADDAVDIFSHLYESEFEATLDPFTPRELEDFGFLEFPLQPVALPF